MRTLGPRAGRARRAPHPLAGLAVALLVVTTAVALATGALWLAVHQLERQGTTHPPIPVPAPTAQPERPSPAGRTGPTGAAGTASTPPGR